MGDSFDIYAGATVAFPQPPLAACGSAPATSIPSTGDRSRDEVAALVFKSLRSCTQTLHAVSFIERLRLCNRLSFADMWGGSNGEEVKSVLAFTWRQVDAAHARGPLLPFLCSRMPRAIVMHWRLLCSALPSLSTSPSSIRWILDVQLRDVLCAHYRHAARTMMPFAPGAAALKESVYVVKDLIADCGGKLGDDAFAASVAEDLIGLVRSTSQTAEDVVDAAATTAALVTQNLQLLAQMCLPALPVTRAAAESYMLMLQVFLLVHVPCFDFIFLEIFVDILVCLSKLTFLFIVFTYGLMLAIC